MSLVDVRVPVPGQAPVAAYVVRPAGPVRSAPGVLYLHWFEPRRVTQNRSEFLGEALTLAGRGVVSLLPQLTFPWDADPTGHADDRSAVIAQLGAVEYAYGALLEQAGVDPYRTAVVGHDYGSMYGAYLAQHDPRIRAAVVMAGDATWANWFDQYWLGLADDARPAYEEVFAGLDPVANVDRLGDRILFQWADTDRFVPPPTREAFAVAAPGATSVVYAQADHALDRAAQDDRLAFLLAQLSVTASST